jgi:hypothetical protein
VEIFTPFSGHYMNIRIEEEHMLSRLAHVAVCLNLTIAGTLVGGAAAWGQTHKICPEDSRRLPVPIDSWNPTALTTVGGSEAARDTTGAYNGIFVGGVTIDPKGNTGGGRLRGFPSSTFQFDGVTGFINMGSSAGDLGTGDFSLEAWFYWDGGGSSIGNIIRKSNYPPGGNGAGYWIRIIESSNTLEFFVGEPVTGTPGAIIVTPITPGEWHHVVGTRTASTGTLALYIDSLPAPAISSQSNLTPGFDVDSTALFTLGAWSDRFGPTEYFAGEMIEVSLYNVVLTEFEVEALTRLGFTGQCYRHHEGLAAARG